MMRESIPYLAVALVVATVVLILSHMNARLEETLEIQRAAQRASFAARAEDSRPPEVPPCPKGQKREMHINAGGALVFTHCDGSPYITMHQHGMTIHAAPEGKP